MNLEDLRQYRNIVIQCHDVPDPDTLASGFALQKYIESIGGVARLVYSGKNSITKPNLKLMLDLLDIPIQYVETLEAPPDLLITVIVSMARAMSHDFRQTRWRFSTTTGRKFPKPKTSSFVRRWAVARLSSGI